MTRQKALLPIRPVNRNLFGHKRTFSFIRIYPHYYYYISNEDCLIFIYSIISLIINIPTNLGLCAFSSWGYHLLVLYPPHQLASRRLMEPSLPSRLIGPTTNHLLSHFECQQYHRSLETTHNHLQRVLKMLLLPSFL